MRRAGLRYRRLLRSRNAERWRASKLAPREPGEGPGAEARMKKSGWWRFLSAVFAALCGLAFGWVAGAGVARAAADHGATPASADCAITACALAQTWVENHSSRRFQPSSAASLRKLGR